MEIKRHTQLIFHEPCCNVWFHASPADVTYAVYHTMRNFHLRGYASLNELFAFLETIPYNRKAEYFGWDIEWLAECWDSYWFDIEWTMNTRKDGIQYAQLCYSPEPLFDKERFGGARDYIDDYRRDWDPKGNIVFKSVS